MFTKEKTLLVLLFAGFQIISNNGLTWIERTFPNKISQEDIVIEPLDNASGCNVIYCPTYNTYYVFNESCIKIPPYLPINVNILHVRTSRITVIHAGDFNNWTLLTTLNIEMNPYLIEIEPGAFQLMNNLKILTISNNYNLKTIEPGIFNGLINLEELNFIKNNMHHLYEFILSINPTTLPSLKLLDLSQNPFNVIKSNDFLSLNQTKIEELYLNLCDLTDIDSNSFKSLTNLRSLDLGSNSLNSYQLANVILNISETSKNITKITLSDNIIDRESSYLFRAISLTNITELNVSQNRFNLLQYGLFPVMVNIKKLDISSLKATDIDNNIFNDHYLPNLNTLIASNNRFPSLLASLLLPNLTELDLSGNSCENCFTSSLFKINQYIFKNMFNLKILNLAKNSLYHLKKYTFYGLFNLEILNLSNCTLYRMDDYLFLNLTNLKQLDLSYNKFINSYSIGANKFIGLKNLEILKLHNCEINSISDSNIFNELINLKYLTLRNNMLNKIDSYWFLPLTKLIELDLTGNDITEWNLNLFINNLNLKVLNLYSNRIRYLTVSMLKDFKYIKKLDLRENQFYCSCKLVLNIKEYLLKYNETVDSIPLNHTNYKCFRPLSLINTKIFDYIENQIKEDYCNYNQTNLILLITLFTVTILSIFVVLIYYLRWHIRYWIFLFRQTMRYNYFPGKKKPTGNNSKYKYDAFVSYSHEDRNFVVRLVSMLEIQSPYYKLCVFERDFSVGDVITESVLECLSISRRTILVLSDSFARSTWCQWEMHLAQHKRLFFKDKHIEPLVIIKIGEIMERHMTPTLKYLIKTRIYLQWNSDIKKQKIFWQKLREALAPPKEEEP